MLSMFHNENSAEGFIMVSISI